MKLKKLYLDIETSAYVIESWTTFEANALRVLEDFKVICFAAKWSGGKTIVRALPDYKGYKKGILNDELLIREIHEIASQADRIVAHNGSSFDIPKLNTRFIHYNLPPLPPHKVIDTLKVARTFGFHSNKLNDLLIFFGLKPKVSTGGYGLWVGCKEGDMRAWRKMKKYNRYDTVGLELVEQKLLPYMKNAPPMFTSSEDGLCTQCGSTNIQLRGFTYTATSKHQQFQCKDCTRWGKFKKNLMEKDEQPLTTNA